MNETDIESSIVVANEESPKILFKVESNEKSDVVRFYSKQDESSTADIVFEVESTDGKATYFHVHRSVLQSSFTVLSELFDSQQYEIVTDLDTIPIPNVDPKVFHCLLIHAYGGVVSDEDFKSCAKDIIEAADQFGFDELKVMGEGKFLESYPISMDSVLDKLNYADAKNCETILSSVMSFLIQNGTEAVEKLSFEGISGHLMKNMLIAANSLVLSTFEKMLETVTEMVGLKVDMVSLKKTVKELQESNETRDEQENRIDDLEEDLFACEEQLEEERQRAKRLEEQLEEEEQRANRLEKQLEGERQRNRYLEDDRQRVWAWYRRARDESKEANTAELEH